jgi:hypothetical protein
MTSLSIIGVSSSGGLGNYLKDHFSSSYEVSTVDRQNPFDYSADIIILNLFDHSKIHLQEQIFRQCFLARKTSRAKIVAIGSTSYHFQDTAYSRAKRSLRDTFYSIGKYTDSYDCSLLLLELGSLEILQSKPCEWPHLKYQQVGMVLQTLLQLDTKFMHVALRGDEMHST